MRKITILGLFVALFFLATFSVFGEGAQEETGETPKWMQIQWNQPKPWAERLKGVELADQLPQSYIDAQPTLADQPKKAVSVGGYTWPEGYEEAVEGVDELSFFNFGGLPHDPAILIANAGFEVKTGIKVNAQAMEELGLWLKTVAAMTAKRSTPQLLDHTPLLSMYHIAAAGWAENANFFWPEEVRKLYGDGAVSVCEVEGNYWASGFVSAKPFVLFYRPSVLKEATGSSEPPANYQELMEMGKKVVQNTDKYGLALPAKDSRYMWYQMSGPFYSMGGRFIKDGKFDVTSSEYREMFDYMVDLFKEGVVPKEALGWSWTDAPETFTRGRAAFLIAGPVNATIWTDNPPAAIEGDWEMRTQLPWEGTGTGVASTGTTAVWSVNTYSSPAEKAAAFLYLDFYRSYQSQWNELGFEGNECVVPDIYGMESIQQQVPYPELRADSVKNTYGESLPVNGDQMIQFQLEWLQKAATGEVSVDEAIENLKKDLDSIGS